MNLEKQLCWGWERREDRREMEKLQLKREKAGNIDPWTVHDPLTEGISLKIEGIKEHYDYDLL